MKNIKLRIVYLILCSALLLFALFMLAVNLIIPAHFVREAKKALISEAQYQNRTIPYTDDGSFFDDEWNDTEEHFLTPSIVFLELDNANQSSGWNRDAYRLEKKLLEYCKGRDLSLNQCYTFKTDKHHLIFMSVQEEQDDWEKPYAYIMYIDIGPITRYIVTLNWAFFAVLLAISSVMCLLGFRFGRDIEKEAERQQTFFQNASHELKTPITSIRVLADSLMGMEEVPVELYREFMADISDEIDRENQIIEDLLTLVKMDKSAESQMNIAQVNINRQLEMILKRLRPIAKRGNVELILESMREVTADVDEVKISLAITNLVENAIKYNVDSGWVRVTLDADHKYFYIKVADSGIGIPEDALDHIFDRFFRVDKARSREVGGTGLGLAITKNVVQMHRGVIDVESVPGEGTTFAMRIPLTYIVRQEARP